MIKVFISCKNIAFSCFAISTGMDLSTTDIYIDGSFHQTDNLTLAIITTYNFNLRIGSNMNGNYFDGIIDDICIYNRTLTVTEIQALYQEGGWTGN